MKIPYWYEISIGSCFINPAYFCYHHCSMNTPLRIRFTWWFREYGITQYRGDFLCLRCKLRQINQNNDLENIWCTRQIRVHENDIMHVCVGGGSADIRCRWQWKNILQYYLISWFLIPYVILFINCHFWIDILLHLTFRDIPFICITFAVSCYLLN